MHFLNIRVLKLAKKTQFLITYLTLLCSTADKDQASSASKESLTDVIKERDQVKSKSIIPEYIFHPLKCGLLDTMFEFM